MKRALFVTGLALLAAGGWWLAGSAGRKAPDFSGRWLMHETDPECKHSYSRCTVEIDQRGDRVTLRAWGEGNDWTCEGRGVVENGRLKFRWMGQQKNWRGWAEWERRGDEVRGTYQRDDTAGAAVQYCRGTRKAVTP